MYVSFILTCLNALHCRSPVAARKPSAANGLCNGEGGEPSDSRRRGGGRNAVDLATLEARRPKGMKLREERQRWSRKGVGINEEGGWDSDDDWRGSGAGEASTWMMERGEERCGVLGH